MPSFMLKSGLGGQTTAQLTAGTHWGLEGG